MLPELTPLSLFFRFNLQPKTSPVRIYDTHLILGAVTPVCMLIPIVGIIPEGISREIWREIPCKIIEGTSVEKSLEKPPINPKMHH